MRVIIGHGPERSLKAGLMAHHLLIPFADDEQTEFLGGITW